MLARLHVVKATDVSKARALAPFSKTVAPIQPLRQSLADITWEDIGVIRDQAGLQNGIARLNTLSQQLEDIGVQDGARSFNMSWHDWLNLKSLIEMSRVIGHAALARENSRGAHYRSDFPEQGDLDSSYFTLVSQDETELNVSRQPVSFSIISPGQSLLSEDEPKTLVAAQ